MLRGRNDVFNCEAVSVAKCAKLCAIVFDDLISGID